MKLLTVSIILFSICPRLRERVVNCTQSKLNQNYKSGKNDSGNNSTSNDVEKSFLNGAETSVGYGNNRHPVKLNMKQGLVMNQILDVYALRDPDNKLCKNHSTELKVGLRALEPWALLMFDSSSKLQSGVLQGNLFEFGAYEQCIKIYKNSNYGVIRGKYCSLRVTPDVELLRKILEFRNITRKRFKKVYQFVSKAQFVWSVCVPDSCPSEDILQHFSKNLYSFTEGLNLTVSLSEEDCATAFTDKPFNREELCILSLLGSFVAIVAVCTVLELFYVTPDDVATNTFVNIFSAYANSKQIFARGKASDLDCVHGIRFLSTCYVVIGHRYLMLMFFPVVNSLKIMDWVVYYRSTVITGGTLCVDSFFMVSGMLVGVGFFKEMAQWGKMNWTIFYLYRYLRITPPLAVVVLCYTSLIHHLGSGPLWHDMLEIIQRPCQEYWWATLLHIQNYVHPFPLCMTQVWYLTCDMQYYFLSPIILIPLWKYPNFGYINFILIYTLSVGSNFYLAWINRYSGGVPVTNQLFSTKYFQHHYITPHTRAATYIIGLGLGYSIHKNRSEKIQIKYPIAVAGWFLAISTMLAALVGCHAFHEENHEYNRMEESSYVAFSRSAWTLGIVWVVWACINGYGGPINSILSSHVFRVLGRISYSIYLWHMLLQYLMSGAAKMPGYFSDFSALSAAFSDLFIMVLIGFAFTVCFESPLVKSLALLLTIGKSNKVQPKGDKK